MPFLREKSGRWSPEKILAFAAVLLPAVWLAALALMGDLGPRPVTEAIHFTGRWAVRFILLSLAVTPARFLFGLPKLINARRTLGVAACCYAALHFTMYIADQKFDLAKVASEIVLRVYLTIGFTALIALIALAITSTDAMIRRLGARWTMLHRAAYLAGLLAVLHFMMQKKLNIYEPILMAGFVLWLLGFRMWRRFGGRVGLVQVLTLTFAATALTALLEAAWFWGMTGAPPLRVLEANFMFDFEIRPMWWTLAAGLAAAAGHLGAQWLWPKPAPRLRAAE